MADKTKTMTCFDGLDPDGRHHVDEAGVGHHRRLPIDFNALRQAVPLTDVLARYGALSKLKRQGSQLAGQCLICSAAPRAFVVRGDTWFCFGPACDRGGGVLELVALREQVNLVTAATMLAQWFGIPLPHRPLRPQQTWSMSMSKPSHHLFIVEDRPSQDQQAPQKGVWYRIGSAWPARDGKGFTIHLAPGMSVSGRLVLREWTPDDARAEKT